MDGWGLCVLERLGLPIYFSAENGGALCMEGDTDERLTDAEILEALKGTVVLASDAAQRLIARGFGSYLGVNVQAWCGETPSYELIGKEGRRTSVQARTQELIPASPKTEILSTVYHGVKGDVQKPLFPGATEYQNELGGRVFVFCGTPQAPYGLGAVFSFLNESRKEQLAQMLTRAGEIPVYYPGDEEVYFRAADMEGGAIFCAMWNLGADPIEEVELSCTAQVEQIERLMPDGSFSPVDFCRAGERLILACDCATMDPLILVLR